MKTLKLLFIGTGLLISSLAFAENPIKTVLDKSIEIQAEVKLMDSIKPEEVFKPSIHVGGIIHMYAGMQQKGFAFGGDPSLSDASDWESDFTVYRGRVLIGAQLSKKGNFFMETELTTSVNGANDITGSKSTRITPMILDAQYEHVFSDQFSVIGGLQLVSHNRNGLQGAAGLMANDFTYYQYPYNLHPNSPLQNNLGRDLGVNFRGFLANEKLEYRLGFFSGRTSFAGTDESPLRTVGRLVYNVFDKDKSFYYSGTNLGNGKTLSIGAGVDTQGSYTAIGGDVFLDMPVGTLGSVTLNGAYSYLTGGNDVTEDYTFAEMIPTQGTQYLELGYYFKDTKLQPWIRYEKQDMNSEDQQTGGISTSDFDKYNTTTVLGGGLNYWFNGYNTNLRLSYTSTTKTFQDLSLNDQTKTYGQLWLQVQLFIF
ncbi:hypothetical protein [Wenyingzhuangia sp. 2_MG-2023]|uniref:hypothetical protein n=1 Tax=Wenyingzhuangia sp. 2_MG-2023 TaxID=3062639 RepID=UPI0026E309A3|nr:hypothetical protein [Wenyingzhuangia sp. 2_MG-2023]MDO6739261.1 hypothetical protein [Wenyingzhuangia sp. 2_MG-2023]